MHVDYVSETSQLVDRFQSAVPLESGLDCQKKEDRDAKEHDVVDAGVSQLIQLIQISQSSRPWDRDCQDGDEQNHENYRDSNRDADQVIRLPEINRRLRHFFPDDDQLIRDLAQSGIGKSLADPGLQALQRAEDVRFVQLSVRHDWNLSAGRALGIDAYAPCFHISSIVVTGIRA